MRKVALLAIVASMAMTTYAWAAGPVSRPGLDYSGIRNPGGCEIAPDNGDLHVKCTAKVASGPAFVRYRFLKDDGAIRDFASVSADVTTWVGEPCIVRWMISAPKHPARTLRIEVPFGSYCHIASVTWSQ